MLFGTSNDIFLAAGLQRRMQSKTGIAEKSFHKNQNKPNTELIYFNLISTETLLFS